MASAAMRIISTDPDQPGFFAIGQVAVGVIAIGQMATGVVAVGQIARGIFCVGQGAVGVFALGQGAIGLWHATAMIGLGGRSGKGGVLHLLPYLVTPAMPALSSTTTIDALLERRESEGWVRVNLSKDGALAGDAAQIDAAAIALRLEASAIEGCNRANVKVRAELVAGESDYRSADAHVTLIAEDVLAWNTRPKTTLRYATLPTGQLGKDASTGDIVLRSMAWLAAAAVFWFVTVQPLIDAFLR